MPVRRPSRHLPTPEPVMTARTPARPSPLTTVATAALLLAAMGASAQQAPAPGPQLRWTGGIAWRAPVSAAPAAFGPAQGIRPTPYLGSEWRLADPAGLLGSGWRIGADLGLSLTPRSALRLGAMGVETPLEDVVRELRLAPVLTLGASYSF